MIRQISVFFIFLACVSLFWFSMVPKNIVLLAQTAAIILMLVVVLVGNIYDRSKRFTQNFGYEISFIFLAIFLSTFGANWGHQQSFGLTMWAQRGMYFYLFYFFLHTTRMRTEDIERLLISISIIYIACFLLQYVAYPRVLFGTRMDEDRGTIRIFLPGKAFVVMMYFYCLQMFFRNHKASYIVFCVLTLLVTLLQGTRSALGLLLLGTILNLVISKQVKSKLLISFLLFLCVIPVFFIFQDIILNLILVSEEQSANEGEDVRVRAARFFLTEFYPSKLNYFIGNGEEHMASAYGMKVFFYKVTFGFFLSDIGIIGEYVKFGIIYVVSVVMIVIKVLRARLDPKYYYFKYYIAISIMGMIVGGTFSKFDAFVPILAMLYIIDVNVFDRKNRIVQVE